MKVQLKNVEPYAIDPVPDNVAQMFLRHLNGSETFEFFGVATPKSWLINDLNYKYPRLTSAHGYLLSISIDEFINICQNNPTAPFKMILDKYHVGNLNIDLGGDLSSPSIYT